MILAWIIAILMISGVLAGISGKRAPVLSRWIALGGLLVDAVLVIILCFDFSVQLQSGSTDQLLVSFQRQWIPQFGIEFYLGVDGLSLIMLLLTIFLGLLAVGVSWNTTQKKVGFYYFNLMWVIAGIAGVFMAFDLFLFYIFWEVMLIPMYFLISIWGHEKRISASYKFFIFTQAGGLLMLLAILGVYYIHGSHTGEYSFNYFELQQTGFDPQVATWLMYGFLIAFLIKLPIVPLHTWLPDAHTQAPVAGSVILAGLLLKTGAYGILRFVIPFFPEAMQNFAPAGMILGVIGIIYGAVLAFAQTDLKRLVAYTSVSHMGFVMIGVFAFNTVALQGVVMQLIAHGLSTGALFILVGVVRQRTGTRDIRELGGLWKSIPKIGAVGLVLVMASLGLPGLANFIAEFLILAGAWPEFPWLTACAALGLIASSIYALRVMQKVFYGPEPKNHNFKDINLRESLILGSVMILLLLLGLWPKPVTRVVEKSLGSILPHTEIEIGATDPETEKHMSNAGD